VAADAPEYIKKACAILEVSNLREEEREAMTLMERANADYEAELEYVEYETARRIARDMIAEKLPLALVQKITRLDQATIQSINEDSTS
jgi:hypothetical protein